MLAVGAVASPAAKQAPTKRPSSTSTSRPSPTPTTAATTTPPKGSKTTAVMALPNETASGWLPGEGQWGAGGTVANAVFDRMTLLGADGTPVPNLLESATSSPDHKTWTLTARSGIAFHNGEPLDGAAIAANLESVRTGSVTGPALVNLAGCAASGQVATCTMRTPWVTFDAVLSTQLGTVAAPAQIKAKDRQHPIGTGPFVCFGNCWTPNVAMKLVRNPTYWRKGLPKLDAIEFRPIPDYGQALAQLQSGLVQFWAYYGVTGPITRDAFAKNSISLTEIEIGDSTIYGVINLAKRDNPLLDVRLRRAWAQSIDLDTLTKLRAPGATPANGPFSKGTVGYLEKTGYPTFNVQKARELVDEYKKEKGVSNVEVTFGWTNGVGEQSLLAVIKQMVEQAGIAVKLAPAVDASAAVSLMLTGTGPDVALNGWFSFADPDAFRPFLGSEGCGGPQLCPLTIGRNVLNWGRVVDAAVDSSFDQIRSNSDPVVRKRAAESINRIYGDQVYALWLYRNRTNVASCTECSGVGAMVGPNGEKVPDVGGGQFLGSAWLSVG